MKKSNLLQIGVAALVAAIVTGIVYMGGITWLDNRVADTLFQKKEASSGKIVVIGIDEKALQAYGPFQSWDRSIMAQALEALNADPENKPAVVAVDTLYSGTTDADVDDMLVKAADELGCVVMGASGAFEKKMILQEDGTYRVEPYAVLPHKVR